MFVEDIQRPDQDFRETKLSDKLPKIEYGSAKHLMQQPAEPMVATPESQKAREQQMLRDLNGFAIVPPSDILVKDDRSKIAQKNLQVQGIITPSEIPSQHRKIP